MSQEDLVIVCWQSRITGKTGQGQPIPRSVATAWLVKADAEFPELFHFLWPISNVDATEAERRERLAAKGQANVA